MQHPTARHEGLIVEHVGSDVVIYDEARDRAHTLNPAAAAVWRHADGRTSVAQLAAVVAAESGLPADESVVELALARLAKAQLLEGGASGGALSRRDVVRRLGLSTAAALMLPAVASLAAPTPADAQSVAGCLGLGELCSISAPNQGNCCPGLVCGPGRFPASGGQPSLPDNTSRCRRPGEIA